MSKQKTNTKKNELTQSCACQYKQNRTNQSKAKQKRKEQDKTKQDKTKYDIISFVSFIHNIHFHCV